MFKHLLVPTDGSPLSDSAVDRAIAFAREVDARITFFYAQPEPPMPIYGDGPAMDAQAPERFKKLAQSRADETLQKAVEAATGAGVVADMRTLVSETPYLAIIDTARERGCDVIFMASHGRRGISGLLLGSETHKVLTHSVIPVLVYR